jgi:enamine deaminase RidA (YjgF/YER057c/UK114 family)
MEPTMSQTSSVEYLAPTERQASRAYSPAIVTRGGRTVYLAGQTALVDLDGKSLLGDFDGQARTIFKMLDKTLQQVGGSLHDMMTMTVFINDQRYGDGFVELRKEFFPAGKYPCSALITVTGFARPGMLIEIQGIAFIAD